MVVCAACSRLDGRTGLFACPLTAIVLLFGRPSWRTADLCAVEFGLVIAQVVALLPMVQ